MNHEPHLKKLLNQITEELQGNKNLPSPRRFISGDIPNELLSEEMKKDQITSFVLTDEEVILLDESFNKLRKDSKTEYLKDSELKNRLWYLVCEIWIKRKEFKNSNELKTKIHSFVEDICKPLKDYEVLFKIHNMDANLEEVFFWDCKITKYDKTSLINWGFQEKKFYIRKINDFENQNLIIVSEKGNNSAEVTKRARVKANKRLRTLQTYLKEGYIHDFQLKFEISEEYAIKEIGNTKIIGTGFNRINSPLNYDYTNLIIENAEKANEDYLLIKKFPSPIQDMLERTLYWIGLSISEIEIDIKIAFLCTALETLLTTQDDGRKGERIAYRGYLLAMEAGSDNLYSQPQNILRVYDLRSKVVHGSYFGIATNEDYRYLLQFTKRTFKNFIIFANINNLNRQSKIYKKLLESKHLIPLLSWLDSFWEREYKKNKMVQFQNHSRDISKFLKEDWFSKKN